MQISKSLVLLMYEGKKRLWKDLNSSLKKTHSVLEIVGNTGGILSRE